MARQLPIETPSIYPKEVVLVLSIEEYISRRKRELNLDETDKEQRLPNMKAFVGITLEYFVEYLDMTAEELATAKTEEKADRYRRELRNYSPEVAEWLVEMNAQYGNKLNVLARNVCKKEPMFTQFSTDAEFVSLAIDLYTRYGSKVPYIRKHHDMVVALLRDMNKQDSIPEVGDLLGYSDEMTAWLEHTYRKYGVNIRTFLFNWCLRWQFDRVSEWPHAKKEKEPGTKRYRYNFRGGGDLADLDNLYRQVSSKPFFKGRKREMECLMMAYWAKDDDPEYWEAYLAKALPSIAAK